MLKPGAEPPTEAELLDWTSARVDEPPARPKRVRLIDTMPMTNVGKIFKPELRRMAAEHTVRDLLAEVCEEAVVSSNLGTDGKITVTVALPLGTGDALRDAARAGVEKLPLQIRF